MYRGRLLHPLLVDIYRLDLAATAAVTNSSDGRTAGLDPEYCEPIMVPTANRIGQSARREMAVLQLPGQIEPESFNRQQMVATGDQKGGFWGVTFHFADLEAASLVDTTTGLSLIKPGDRLGAIRKMDGTLVQEFPDPPGMYCLEALPTGWGIGGERNLLLVKFQSRN
jgi:hypothetical protein